MPNHKSQNPSPVGARPVSRTDDPRPGLGNPAPTFILLILLILFPLISFSQELQFQQEQYPFPVTFYGIEPQLGYIDAGSYYHHDFGDLDNDGDWDIILNTGSGRELYIENIGTNYNPSYELITNQIVELTSSEDSITLVL